MQLQKYRTLAELVKVNKYLNHMLLNQNRNKLRFLKLKAHVPVASGKTKINPPKKLFQLKLTA